MDQAADPTGHQVSIAIKALRVGNTATEAAEAAGLKPGDLYAVARHHPDLLLALAGHDPYAQDAQQIFQQADYVRLMALGFTPTQAARVLFHGDERVKGWRAKNTTFAQVADRARRLNPPGWRQRRENRFTPHRVRQFLEEVERGTPATRAAEAAGITSATVYQRRRRDAQFRESMDQARARARQGLPAPAAAVTEEQWETFGSGVREGMTLRRAAQEAGVFPQHVYNRRRDDPQFRRVTDRWRGENGT